MGPHARGEEERLLYWNREIEASRAAELRCFLAGYSLMGPKEASRLRSAEGNGRCLRWCCVLCASQLLCLLLLYLLYLLYLLQLFLQGELHPLLQCFLLPWLSSFSSWRASCAGALALLHLTPKSVQTTGTPWCHEIEDAGGIADLSTAQRVQSRFRSFRRSICIEKPRQPRGIRSLFFLYRRLGPLLVVAKPHPVALSTHAMRFEQQLPLCP